MINVGITDDKQYLTVEPQTMHELKQIELAFTRSVPNAFILKKTAPWLPLEKTFFNTDFRLLCVGHWLHFLKVCEDYVLPVTLENSFKNYIGDFNLSKEEFVKFIDKTFEGALNEVGEIFYPYDYQIDCAYSLLKYKKCTAEVSTSGGKTLISYLIFKYLYEVKGIKRMFYIVPSVDLGTQTIEKFELYDSLLKTKGRPWTGGILKSLLKKREKELVGTCNILFGTYQSLCKKPPEFFNSFQAQLCDECHHATNNSVRNILDKCANLEYSFGVTGTYPSEDSYDYMMLTSLLGPVVYKFSTYQLIYEKKTGTPIHVAMVLMNYATDEEKFALYDKRLNMDKTDPTRGAKLLKEEQIWINENDKRLRYIGSLACKTKVNTLVLFGDIKYGYGQKLFDYINMNSKKDVFYCDGSTPTENRDYYKQKMQNDTTGNTIIVASIGVFGEGIDVPNLSCIFLVNTVKSARLVRQILGRGLRKSSGKTHAMLFDFVDDLRIGSGWERDNYMWKHQRERKKIYYEHKFPVHEINADMENDNPGALV